MKSPIRWSRASASTRRRVEKLIALGWEPGDRPADVLGRRRKGRAD